MVCVAFIAFFGCQRKEVSDPTNITTGGFVDYSSANDSEDDLDGFGFYQIVCRSCGVKTAAAAPSAKQLMSAGCPVCGEVINNVQRLKHASQTIGGGRGAFVASRQAKVVHRSNCFWATRIRSDNAVYFSDRRAAARRGYRSCDICNP